MSDLLEEGEMRANASQDSSVAACHLPARKHNAEQQSNASEEGPCLIEFLSEAREKLRRQPQPPRRFEALTDAVASVSAKDFQLLPFCYAAYAA